MPKGMGYGNSGKNSRMKKIGKGKVSKRSLPSESPSIKKASYSQGDSSHATLSKVVLRNAGKRRG